MTVVALSNFIEVWEPGERRLVARYQNGSPSVVRYRSASYNFLNFIYQGAAKNRTGDNMESAVLLSVNKISMDIGHEAVKKRCRVRVYSCVMNQAAVSRTLTEENWIASSMSYDFTTLEIVLSSSIDAVGSNAPNRVLSRNLVGALPVTASLSTR